MGTAPFAFIVASNAHGERWVVKFDVESLPFVRLKLAEMIGDGILGEATADFLWRQARQLASELEMQS